MPSDTPIAASRFGISMDGVQVVTTDTFHFSGDAGGTGDEGYGAPAELGNGMAMIEAHFNSGDRQQQVDDHTSPEPTGDPLTANFGGLTSGYSDDWL